MPQINFDTLTADRPDLHTAFSELSAWFREHAQVRLIDPRRLARDLPNVSDQQLAEALFYLRRRGMLRQMFALQAPNGTLLGDTFSSPKSVPKYVRGRFDENVDTSDCRIVTVYREDPASER